MFDLILLFIQIIIESYDILKIVAIKAFDLWLDMYLTDLLDCISESFDNDDDTNEIMLINNICKDIDKSSVHHEIIKRINNISRRDNISYFEQLYNLTTYKKRVSSLFPKNYCFSCGYYYGCNCECKYIGCGSSQCNKIVWHPSVLKQMNCTIFCSKICERNYCDACSRSYY